MLYNFVHPGHILKRRSTRTIRGYSYTPARNYCLIDTRRRQRSSSLRAACHPDKNTTALLRWACSRVSNAYPCTRYYYHRNPARRCSRDSPGSRRRRRSAGRSALCCRSAPDSTDSALACRRTGDPRPRCLRYPRRHNRGGHRTPILLVCIYASVRIGTVRSCRSLLRRRWPCSWVVRRWHLCNLVFRCSISDLGCIRLKCRRNFCSHNLKIKKISSLVCINIL